MNADRIVIRRTEQGSGYYTVEAEGRMCTFLCWSEMLDQVIALTHPDIQAPRYHWRTTEEEIAEEQRHKVAVAKANAPEESVAVTRTYNCDVCCKVSVSPINTCGFKDCPQIPF